MGSQYTLTRDDRMVRAVRSIVHELGFVGSTVGLSALHYIAARSSRARSIDQEDRRDLFVSRIVHSLGETIETRPYGPGGRAPRLFVSLHKYPSPADALTRQRKELLGPPSLRGNRPAVASALERGLAHALRERLPSGFGVAEVGRYDHKGSNDILLTGPNGWSANLEARNHRSNVLDTFEPRDVAALNRDRDLGRTMLFVVPAATTRAKRFASDHGAQVIETGVYIAPTLRDRDMWLEHGWGAWETEIAEDGLPSIADSVMCALSIASDRGLVGVPERMERDSSPGFTEAESTLEAAMRLYGEGVSTAAEAARILGKTPPAISNAFSRDGRPSPWREGHGGFRRGSGRKSSSQEGRPSTA